MLQYDASQDAYFILDWNQSSFEGETAALLNWPKMFAEMNKLEAKCRKYQLKVPKARSAQMIDGRRPNHLHNDVCERLQVEINAMCKRLIRQGMIVKEVKASSKAGNWWKHLNKIFSQEQCKLKDDDSLKSMSMEEISEKWKALGDHAKRKYKKKSIKSFEKYKEDKIKLDLPKAPKVNTFISRTQLKAAYDKMQELDPLQVESVKAMGFGSIFELKRTKLDRSLFVLLRALHASRIFHFSMWYATFAPPLSLGR
ncbi:hypothetical protein RHMOL_Rhmol10G0188000 [Rhododendron molle]|uniref:Uncharacterized protein n=1 Tax=Rhododendron molle TaxID=49168 RepID=A0ACC0M3N9_RHOML|nr:hypothetical protein RHMOL_Rhmol10G0188000 [Rhododendron molle]